MGWEFVDFVERPNGTASFNDDSSPDQRLTNQLKVSVDAQVLPGKPLSWFYDVLSWFPVSAEELKSRRFIEKFVDLPTEKRSQIFRNGLAEVRIHIVDPRLHQHKIDAMLRSIFKRDDAPEWLDQEVANGSGPAARFKIVLREQLAESILHGSSAGRLHRLIQDHRFDDCIFAGDFNPKGNQPFPVSLEDFDCDVKCLVRKATEWAAKSAAAFHPSIDSVFEIDNEDFMNTRFFAFSMRMKRKLMPKLNERHTFDKGDQRQLIVLESCRTSMLKTILSSEPCYPLGLLRGKAYDHEESHKSVYVQAADFAAGLASYFYSYPAGPVEVASRFEYVTHNGVRISISDAEEITRQVAQGRIL